MDKSMGLHRRSNTKSGLVGDGVSEPLSSATVVSTQNGESKNASKCEEEVEDQSDDVVITEMIQTVEDHFEEINFVEPPSGSTDQKISLKSAYKKGNEKCRNMRRSSSRENESKTSCYSTKNGRPLLSRQTTKGREPLLN